MPMMKNVLGLDLGTHTIKAVELRQTLRGLEPAQLRVHPRTDADAPLPESIHRFVKMHQLATEHVACAVPSDRISTRRLEFPFRDRRKLSQAVPWEIAELIPFELEDVIVDWEIVGGERPHSIVAATMAKREDVAALLGALDEAECTPRVLDAEGLVLGNLAALFDLPGTRLIVDFGHTKTTVCLMIDEAAVAARAIPIGGLALTQAIASDLGVSLEEAERQKCEEGLFDIGFNSRSAGAVALLDRIAREIMRTTESLEDALGGAAKDVMQEITLVGGGSRLHRFDEYLAERTGIPCNRIALPEDSEGAALVAGGDPVLFAPAIALALRASSKSRSNMNFRQDEFAYRARLADFFGPEARPTMIMAAIVAVLLVGAGITNIALESVRADRLEAQAMGLYSDRFPNETPPPRPVSAMRLAVDEAREKADFLGVYAGNSSALDLMTELSGLVPADLKVRFDEITIDRKLVRVKVSAENYEAADRLENVLAASPTFQSASVSGQIKKARDGAITFGISIPLEKPGETS